MKKSNIYTEQELQDMEFIMRSNPTIFYLKFQGYENGRVIFSEPSEFALQDAKNDLDIFRERQKAILKNKVINCGDYVLLKNGTYERITVNNWDDSVQVGGLNCGSYHIFSNGNCSYSGGCGDAIQKNKLILTDELKDGQCWIFSQNDVGGGRGVYFNLKFKVWKEIE